MRHAGILLAALLVLPLSAFAAGPAPTSFTAPVVALGTVPELALEPVETQRLLAEADAREPFAGPLIFAEAQATSYGLDEGTWEQLADGSRLWRLRLSSPGATSLSLRLGRFVVPAEARLWLYVPDRSLVQGPYDLRQLSPEGELWTALVPGDRAVVELLLPAAVADAAASLEISAVHRGFRPVGASFTKQGSCNNDVICPEGNPWRDQIRAVGWFTVGGIGLCTGTLMNDTAADFTPYLLTAEHCRVTPANAGSMVVYWNFESPTCGQLSGGSLADNQSGALWRAGDDGSDFTLVELLAKPAAAFNVFYAGWDATTSVPNGVVGIHHPNLDEKAISFDNDTLQIEDASFWRVGQWDDGTTEPGSSGSCIFRKDTKRCVGTLTGGIASCSQPDGFDVYGRMSAHWDGPNKTSRLRDWLDPTDSGLRSLAGADPDSGSQPPGPCVEDADTACLNQDRFEVSITWRDFQDNTGVGHLVPGASDDSALFWFFKAANWEVLVKVLRACGVNQRYWVLGAAATNVEYTITVTDHQTGQTETYENPLGRRAPAIADTSSFAVCP